MRYLSSQQIGDVTLSVMAFIIVGMIVAIARRLNG